MTYTIGPAQLLEISGKRVGKYKTNVVSCKALFFFFWLKIFRGDQSLQDISIGRFSGGTYQHEICTY